MTTDEVSETWLKVVISLNSWYQENQNFFLETISGTTTDDVYMLKRAIATLSNLVFSIVSNHVKTQYNVFFFSIPLLFSTYNF